MSKVYVPGYGYVDSSGPGTSGSVNPGNRREDSGQRRPTTNKTPTNSGWKPSGSSSGSASSSDPWSALGGVGPSQQYLNNYGQPSNTPGTTTSTTKRLSDLYSYPKWTSLDMRTQNLYNDLAKSYYHSSTGKAWYEKEFIPYANSVKEQTGIAPDPEYLALKFAMDNGYDVSRYLQSSESLSQNSVLFDEPGALPGTATSGGSDGSGSSGGSYGGGGYGGGGSGGSGGGQVSLTNPTSARGLLLQTMQNVLGRNPTESEYSTFLTTLNESQMNNPMTVAMDGNNVVQSGGVDPNVLALEFAQGAEDYKSVEASKYFNMFMAALGGASGG